MEVLGKFIIISPANEDQGDFKDKTAKERYKGTILGIGIESIYARAGKIKIGQEIYYRPDLVTEIREQEWHVVDEEALIVAVPDEYKIKKPSKQKLKQKKK